MSGAPPTTLGAVPDVSSLVTASGSLQSQVQTLLDTLRSLDPQNPASLLGSLSGTFDGLSGAVQVDTSALTSRFPQALQALQAALPENTLSSLESFGETYTSLQGLLSDNPIVGQISAGSSLQDTALAVIAEAQTLFSQRLDSLTGGLIDPGALGELQTFISDLARFQGDFGANQADFLPFVARNLLGVTPDILAAPLAHLNSVYAVLAPLDGAAVSAALDAGRGAALSAYSSLIAEINAFDPADAAAYARIELHLTALETQNALLSSALHTLYQSLQTLVANHTWDTIFSVYVDLLKAISFEAVFSVDDLVALLANLLEEMLARLSMVFSADDLKQRLDVLNQTVRQAVISSPLGQIRPSLQAFLDEIRQAIASIPTETIQETVDQIFARVQTELDDLQIDQVQEQINEAFQGIETFITDQINTSLVDDIGALLDPLAVQAQQLPVAGLVTQLTNAVGALQGVIDELTAALNTKIEELNELLSQLEGLSFQPVSNEVIGEIDDLKSRLEAINPNALSDAEKLAIQGALAVIRAIDLEGAVINGLKDAYHAAEGEVKSLLDQLNAALQGLSGRFNVFSPDALLSPVNDILAEGAQLVDSLNGQTLLGFLYDLLEELKATLQALNPGQLLDPLQAPYNEIMAAVNRLNPAAWLAPLRAIYAEIDRLISLVDITPLMDRLQTMQNELFADIRTTLLTALDGLNLPEPLGSFFSQLRPVLELMTEALFGDPAANLPQLSLEIRSRVSLGSLFAPLDSVFMQLVDLIEQVPAADLTTAMNAIRVGVGVGLEALDPNNILLRFRSAHSRLAELSPQQVLGAANGLPTLKASFNARAAAAPANVQADHQAEILSVSARFDVVFNAVNPGLVGGQLRVLQAEHQSLLDSLRQRTNALNHSSALPDYARLSRSLDKLLPDFLRQPQPLSHAEIIAGFYAMRPSTKAGVFERVMERFLQQVKPFETALAPGINDFFQMLHDLISLINPLAVRDAVAAIYTEIRAKVRIIDPEALTSELTDLMDTLTAPLQAINPAQIKAQINAVYASALTALTTQVRSVLDELAAAITAALSGVRAAFQALVAQIQAAISAILADLHAVFDRLEELVFVDILERLSQVLDNLGMSFDSELDRVRNAFDSMIDAIPLDSGASIGAGI